MQNQFCRCPEKLYRSENNRVIAGVAGGLGERYQIDPNIFRAVFVVLGLLFGLGVILYLLFWVFVPVRSQAQNPETQVIASNVKNIDSKVKSWSELLADGNSLKIIVSIVVIIAGLAVLIASGIGVVDFIVSVPLVVLLIAVLLVLWFLIK